MIFIFKCHSERSEESVGIQVLRFAQDDRGVICFNYFLAAIA